MFWKTSIFAFRVADDLINDSFATKIRKQKLHFFVCLTFLSWSIFVSISLLSTLIHSHFWIKISCWLRVFNCWPRNVNNVGERIQLNCVIGIKLSLSKSCLKLGEALIDDCRLSRNWWLVKEWLSSPSLSRELECNCYDGCDSFISTSAVSSFFSRCPTTMPRRSSGRCFRGRCPSPFNTLATPSSPGHINDSSCFLVGYFSD